MGLTHIHGEVSNGHGRARSLDFLVDSGATYTLLPEDVWREIGITPTRRKRFVLADGTKVERGISECFIRLPQGAAHTPVVLGEQNDDALLGTVTLEILGLVLNPFSRTLHPMRMLLG